MNTPHKDNTHTEEAQGLRQKLEAMIANQDWHGIGQMLRDSQHRTITSSNNEVFEVLSTVNRLPFELLKQREGKETKALLSLLVAFGGKDFVMRKYEFDGPHRGHGTLLHAVCGLNLSVEIVSQLIDVGGRDLVMEKTSNFRNCLHLALHKNASVELVFKLIDVGGKGIVFEKDEHGRNALHYACIRNTSIEIVSKLVEVGGREVLMEKSKAGRNPLHLACKLGASVELISNILQVGGRNLVMAKAKGGWNSLHLALSACTSSSTNIVSKLIEVGGRDLVMDKGGGNSDCNSLHVALYQKASLEIISELVEVGQRELVMEKNKQGRSSLHIACYSNSTIEVVSKLIELGGMDLIFEKTAEDGLNSLHVACGRRTVELALVDLLIQHGGAQLLSHIDDHGRTPLHFLITRDAYVYGGGEDSKVFIDKASLLMNKGIQLRIGGEYDIGGLFSPTTTTNQEIKDRIYHNWDRIVLPTLKNVMTIPHNQHLPILQAVIINDVPSKIIKATINQFTGSINTKDSSGRLPIDVAVHRRLSWDNGMKELIEAYLSLQEESSTIIFMVCLKNGLGWENGMKVVVKRLDINVIERQDGSTGLCPFMLADVKQDKDDYDLGSVFHLIRKSPRLVQSTKYKVNK